MTNSNRRVLNNLAAKDRLQLAARPDAVRTSDDNALKLHPVAFVQSLGPCEARPETTPTDESSLTYLAWLAVAQGQTQQLGLLKTSSKITTGISSSDLAFRYLRLLKKGCKVLICALILYYAAYAQPDLLFKGLYQGFAHGWQSECYDWYKCQQ